MKASLIIIGNEILSGRTKDINTSCLALWLNSIGVKVQEVKVIPDIEEKIVNFQPSNCSITEIRKINDRLKLVKLGKSLESTVN